MDNNVEIWMKKLFLVLLLLPVSVSAEFLTGNELLTMCEEENSFNKGQCVGYIEGVYDGQKTMQEWENTPSSTCLSKGVIAGQLVRIVVKHLNDNPATLHLSAGSYVLNALESSFPCK